MTIKLLKNRFWHTPCRRKLNEPWCMPCIMFYNSSSLIKNIFPCVNINQHRCFSLNRRLVAVTLPQVGINDKKKNTAKLGHQKWLLWKNINFKLSWYHFALIIVGEFPSEISNTSRTRGVFLYDGSRFSFFAREIQNSLKLNFDSNQMYSVFLSLAMKVQWKDRRVKYGQGSECCDLATKRSFNCDICHACSHFCCYAARTACVQTGSKYVLSLHYPLTVPETAWPLKWKHHPSKVTFHRERCINKWFVKKCGFVSARFDVCGAQKSSERIRMIVYGLVYGSDARAERALAACGVGQGCSCASKEDAMLERE
jgi:hypothetical protein